MEKYKKREPDMLQVTVWRMRTRCWAPKAANAHTQYAIRIAFPRRRWLQERMSVLHYTCIACLVYLCYMVRILPRLQADALFGTVTQDAT